VATDNIAIESMKFAKSSPGLFLVLVGFATTYFVTVARGDVAPSLATYLILGFSFLVTMFGVIFLFRDLARPNIEDAEFSLSAGSSDIEHAVTQLGKNYDILRRQATQGFVLAGTFMVLGILVILAGSLGDMFGFTNAASNLTTIAGVIVETVSGLGLYLFKETFKRLNSTSDRLHEMWKILAAFRKAETLPRNKRAMVIEKLIHKLVEIPLTTKKV